MLERRPEPCVCRKRRISRQIGTLGPVQQACVSLLGAQILSRFSNEINVAFELDAINHNLNEIAIAQFAHRAAG
jgi:hypothetical protein